MKLWNLTTLACLLLCATPSLIHAQTAGTGALEVTVADSNGASIQGATVTVISNATNEKRTAVTGPEGTSRLALLLPGTYQLQVQMTGFKTVIQSSVSVSVTEVTKVNVTLEPGAIEEKINVQANAELVQTESPALGRVVSEQTVNTLPLVNRNYTQILGLSTGIVSPKSAIDSLRPAGVAEFFSLSGSKGQAA